MSEQETRENIICNLNYEDFREFITIFQNEIFGRLLVNVDGPYDNGIDFLIFDNNHEMKICTQLTIQKDNLKDKIKKDFQKILNCVKNYNYLPIADIFVSQKMTNKTQNELKVSATKEGLTIEIYDAKKLAQMSGTNSLLFLKQKYVESMGHFGMFQSISKVEKVFYDCLSIGNDSTDIKDSLLNSVIVDVVFSSQNNCIEKADLIKQVKEQITNIDDKTINDQINKLRAKQILLSDPQNNKKINISEEEKERISRIYEENSESEEEFIDSLTKILDKYEVENKEEVSDLLYKMHTQYFLSLINDNSIFLTDDETKSLFGSFKDCLEKHCKNNVEQIISEISELCKDNMYLAKVGAGVSFMELVKSHRLELYLKEKTKIVFLDTPVITYLILAWSGLCKYNSINEWSDTYYRGVLNFWNNIKNYEDVKLICSECYIEEVIGQIVQAKQLEELSKMLDGDIEDLGNTRNNFFNYYRYLTSYELENPIDDIDSFFEALGLFGIPDTYQQSDNTELFNCICEILETCNISWINCSYDPQFENIKNEYETKLPEDKQKSKRAIKNDVAQANLLTQDLYDIVGDYNYADFYIVTWDSTFQNLIKITNSKTKGGVQHNVISINPYQICGRIGLEKFKIKDLNATSGIFCYADVNYGVAHKIRHLLDMLAPLVKFNANAQILKQIRQIYDEQLQIKNNYSNEHSISEGGHSTVEEAISVLITNLHDNNLERIWSEEIYVDIIIESIKALINSNKKGREEIIQQMIQKIQKRIEENQANS